MRRDESRHWRSSLLLTTLLLSAGCGDQGVRLEAARKAHADPAETDAGGARSSNAGGASSSGGAFSSGGASSGGLSSIGGATGSGNPTGGAGGVAGAPGGTGGALGSAGALGGMGGALGSAGAGSSRCAGKLFGLSAYGEAWEWHSLHVDLATGVTTTLAHDPRISSVDSAGTFDPGTNRVYARGSFRAGETAAGLLTFDAKTGVLVGAAPLDEGVVVIEIDRDGRLLGMSTSADGYPFGVVDPATGALRMLDRLLAPPVAAIGVRSSAYDPIRNVFYQPGYVSDASDWQPTLFAIDATTGTVSSSAPSEELSDLKADASGRLVGLVHSPLGWRVSSIDPLSAKSTPIGQAVFDNNLQAGMTAIDPEAGIFLKQTLDDLSQDQYTEADATIWAVDIATGEVEKLVTLDRPLYALELVESCRPRH